MASRSKEHKPHIFPPLAGPSTSSKLPVKLSSEDEQPQPLPESGSTTEEIEMEKLRAEARERERLLTSENKPNRLEGKENSNPTTHQPSPGTSTIYHRKKPSLTGNTEDAYLSSDDEAASAALLKGRRKDRTSWFTTPPVHGKRGEKYKRSKVSKVAVCIGITGGVTVLVSLIVGGGVMVLGRKPVAKSEGWYPTREFNQSPITLRLLLISLE